MTTYSTPFLRRVDRAFDDTGPKRKKTTSRKTPTPSRTSGLGRSSPRKSSVGGALSGLMRKTSQATGASDQSNIVSIQPESYAPVSKPSPQKKAAPESPKQKKKPTPFKTWASRTKDPSLFGPMKGGRAVVMDKKPVQSHSGGTTDNLEKYGDGLWKGTRTVRHDRQLHETGHTLWKDPRKYAIVHGAQPTREEFRSIRREASKDSPLKNLSFKDYDKAYDHVKKMYVGKAKNRWKKKSGRAKDYAAR